MEVTNHPMFMYGVTDGTKIDGRTQLDVQGIIFNEEDAARTCEWLTQLCHELGQDKIKFEYVPVTISLSMSEVQAKNVISLDDSVN